LLINPTEVPKITNIAGPIQHDVASNEVNIVPILDILALFNSIIFLIQPDTKISNKISREHNNVLPAICSVRITVCQFLQHEV
jgi:hypothetical protein